MFVTFYTTGSPFPNGRFRVISQKTRLRLLTEVNLPVCAPVFSERSRHTHFINGKLLVAAISANFVYRCHKKSSCILQF